MKIKYILFLILCFIVSTNAFADVVGLVISNEFPSDGLMLENHIYKNSATFENLGVYSGTVYAKAIYTDIPHYCDPGYYLPENTTECVICAENNYCVGGENASMQSCPDGLVSPAGATVVAECGKIMRVGENSLYLTSEQQTTPALTVRLDGDIYYAKMTPVSDGAKQMNINTTDSLRTKIDGVEYSIHDNTVKDDLTQGEQ